MLQNLPPDASTPAPTATRHARLDHHGGRRDDDGRRCAGDGCCRERGRCLDGGGASSTAAHRRRHERLDDAGERRDPDDAGRPGRPDEDGRACEEKDRSNARRGPVPARSRSADGRRRSRPRQRRVDPSSGQWSVHLTMKARKDGIDGWNQLATRCFNRDATCPTGQIAIVLDGVVKSAPVVADADVQPGPDPDLRQLQRARGEEPRPRAALRRAAGAARAAGRADRVGHASGKDSLRAGLSPASSASPRRALHARLLPAARPRRARAACSMSGALLWSVDLLPRGDARAWRSPSPASPASSCRSASPSTPTSSTSSA